MNKDYFVKQLMTFAEEYKIEVSEELQKAGIPCTIEGPFPKLLPKHGIPKK